MKQIRGTPYEIEPAQCVGVDELSQRVAKMRAGGALTPDVLRHLRKYFRIKNIYHSNAIEGNLLDVGETRLVVEQGLTLTGKSLKDQAEARNLSAALDFLEELASAPRRPITAGDVRLLHAFVLRGIDDANAGAYRTVPVEISGSQFKPTAPESIAPEMEEFGKWLQDASVPGVVFEPPEALLVAAAAHTWFVMIHPFIDGNGRVARMLMNLVLMRYGYPIAIVTKEDRLRYYDALEAAQASDLSALVSLVYECVAESLEEYKAAADEKRAQVEWAQSIAGKFDQREKTKASNQYEVWKSAMDLLRSLFKQTTEVLNSSAGLGNIYFKDFGVIEFEKYLSLKNHGSAKKTWYFRIDFRSGDRAARYLFFFGTPSAQMRGSAEVTLLVSREEPAGSFFYERLEHISAPNVPNFLEIGYRPSSEKFVVRGKDGRVREDKAEVICRTFIEDVVGKHFS